MSDLWAALLVTVCFAALVFYWQARTDLKSWLHWLFSAYKDENTSLSAWRACNAGFAASITTLQTHLADIAPSIVACKGKQAEIDGKFRELREQFNTVDDMAALLTKSDVALSAEMHDLRIDTHSKLDSLAAATADLRAQLELQPAKVERIRPSTWSQFKNSVGG